MQTFSIIVPVYFNELNLPETIPQLLSLEERLPGFRLELVFVDDGSGDRSLEILLDYRDNYPEKLKVVKLTRNFGSMAAIQAGFTVATGSCVGVIAADLQDPPELFLEMIALWAKGLKVVLAVRSDREESFMQKFFSNTYYACMRRFAIQNYPPGGFDFFLIDRQVVDEVNRIHEKNTNIMSLIFWLGHTHVMLPYIRRNREKGKSRWTFSKKLKLFIDSFVAFSYLPIRALSVLGLAVAASSFIYGGFIFYVWSVSRIEVKGWTPIMILLAFTAGIQMTMLGVLGEYLWRTLDETRKRPGYVIDETY
jgi:dolichol-phosphate mannosyltransferase